MKKNDIVEIQNCSFGGKIINEGKAKLISKVDRASSGGWSMWNVEFLKEEGSTYERWVDDKGIVLKV